MQSAAEIEPRAIELTVLMPCLDEARTVATCVRKALEVCQLAELKAEVLVADNGSRDGSPELARAAGAGITDAHCGMRGFSREAIRRLSLHSMGMEFASEMVIRAAQERVRIGEVPTSLKPDGRGRRPHLRTWRDGWRHLRFMLLFSPAWLFLVPGLLATALGLALTAGVALTTIEIFGRTLQTHFALLGSALALFGLQVCFLGIFAKTVFVLDGIGKSPGIVRLIDGFELELALLVGVIAFGAGLAIDLHIVLAWLKTHGGTLAQSVTNLAILGGTLIGLGVEVIFSSFFLSILKASRTKRWV